MTNPIERKQFRSSHAFFAGSAPLPTLTLGAGKSTFTVSPKTANDTLAAKEPIMVTPDQALPAGLNISYAIVTGQNTVEIGFTSALSIVIATMGWTVTALR